MFNRNLLKTNDRYNNIVAHLIKIVFDLVSDQIKFCLWWCCCCCFLLLLLFGGCAHLFVVSVCESSIIKSICCCFCFWPSSFRLRTVTVHVVASVGMTQGFRRRKIPSTVTDSLPSQTIPCPYASYSYLGSFHIKNTVLPQLFLS